MKIAVNTPITAAKALALTAACALHISQAQPYTTASAINNAGQIAGGGCNADCTAFHASVITRGGLQDFGTFGGPGSLAYGMNDSGAVVGQSDTDQLLDGEYVSLAFLVDRSGLHNLGTLPGYHFSQAFAINNRGLIVGHVYNSSPLSAPMRAVVFHRGGEIQELGTLGGSTSIAFAVNDRGHIVGRSRTAAGLQHAFVYDGKVMKDLGTLGGNLSTARGINSQGWIVGGSRLSTPGQSHAFVVIAGEMRGLGTLGGAFSDAFAINAAGLIVGASDFSGARVTHAFAYSNGVMRDLGTLGGAYSAALAVNDRGDIVGEAETATGEVHAFLYRDGVMKDLTIAP